ncbi:pyridoxal phosphate-dependent transferase [Pisolithus orientalis]|uniref:pyridoxal phosphate-dependent transferase n=1 Tax=Pisolithus orientalis TaxID=936130 RepID=UPI0022242329|nr:pyridoxal phosphate-dependent transferase [Pisolithus orientalis]KAI6025733.1 pyridoxal phosphate-dependent transferase [Pisolithus orientalis]
MRSLDQKLSAALKSRDERLIRRRLPEFSQIVTSGQSVIDFTSNDYLSLSRSPTLRRAVLDALSSTPDILGSGGSRLLVPAPAHAALEARLCRFFDAEAAILFNSGFDANVGLFSAVPQLGDVVIYDELIHASVHDGMRTSRLSRDSLISFAHNSVPALKHIIRRLLSHGEDLKTGKSSIFVAVESLYSMDGTFAPLSEIVDCVEEMLPLGNGFVIVDEAHATGIYGPKGRGLVTSLGLEKRIFARLHTFGKSLAASGAVLLVTELVRDYLLNYARSFIYTTALTNASVIAAGCSFDMLEDGTTEVLAAHLMELCAFFVNRIRVHLKSIPPTLLRLPDHLQESTGTPSSQPFQFPSQIIPLLTAEPRSLSTFLLAFSPSEYSNTNSHHTPPSVAIYTKPIFPPTVPRETSRVRICLQAGHTREDVEILIQGIVAWAHRRIEDARRDRKEWNQMASEIGVRTWMESKL